MNRWEQLFIDPIITVHQTHIYATCNKIMQKCPHLWIQAYSLICIWLQASLPFKFDGYDYTAKSVYSGWRWSLVVPVLLLCIVCCVSRESERCWNASL